MTGLHWENQRLVGDDVNHARLADLLRKALRWYSIVSALVVAIILPSGIWFLGRDQVNAAAVTWKGPWVLLSIVVALSLSIAPVSAIIEGCGRVAEVTRVRMWEGMATGIALWTGLLSGCRLYSAPLASTASLLVTVTWLLTTKRCFLADLLFRVQGATLAWWREIAPLQWRTAVAWISGYFAYQFFTPAVFTTHGAALAGRLGMTLNLINVVGAVSLSWMQTKASPFGQMVANRDWRQLDTLFRRTLVQAMGAYVLGCIFLLGVMQILRWLQHPIAARLLESSTALTFMAAAGLNQIVFCRSILLRAHKAEPFYGLQLANGVVVGFILLVLVPRVSLPTVALAYLLCACLPVLLISGVIFRRYRTKVRAQCTTA